MSKPQKNKTEVKFVKEKTPSLLATLVRNTGRALTEQELRQIHRMLKIAVVVDGEAPTTISHDTLIVRGEDILAKEIEERKELDALVSEISASVDAQIKQDPSTKFDKSTPAAFKAAVAAWGKDPKRSAGTFKKVFGFTSAKAASAEKKELLSQIFLHFRA